MRKKIRKERDNEWCQIEIELREREGGKLALSICGSEGYIMTQKQAKKDSLRYWESFFEDSPEEMKHMNERCGKRFRSPTKAAEYVLATDGDYHGLDVVEVDETNDKVYAVSSCGQIRSTLNEWFPEVSEYFKYHLNDLHAMCEHQDAKGQTWSTHPGVTCETCGWKLGHGWNYRPLPAEVIEWAQHPTTKITEYSKADLY